MLELLQTSPAMDRLSEKDQLDLGENRSRLVSAYTRWLWSRAASWGRRKPSS